MSTDVAENLFNSIQTIVDKNLEKLNFDTTVKGYIVDNSEATKGKYIVKIGSNTYEAYSENLEYEINDNVYVSIQNNDYSEVKIIKGKVLSTEDEDYIKEDTSSIFLDMTGDMASNVISGQLVANHPEVSKQQTLLLYETFNAESHINYNKIYLSADFRTQLSGYNIVEGSYGLKVVIENNKEEDEQKEYYFDCSQMFGRVYNFFKDTKQSIILNIENEEAITSVSLYFYQVGGTFYNDKKEFLEYDNIPSNLFVSNIDFRMGYDSSSFAVGEEKLFLTTDGNLSYGSEINADLNRTLTLRWLHWDNGVPAMIDNNSELDFKIEWYHFLKASLQKEEDKSLEKDDNWVLLESEIIDDKSFVNYVILNSLNDEEKFKVVITYGENNDQIESEELIFTNKDYVVPVSPEDSGIIFNILDETNGNYFLYGQDNLILNKTELNTLRQIKVEFQNYSKEDENLLNKNNWKITWSYPTDNTMINQPFISSSAENIEGDIFNYYIKENYSPFLLNNTIKCVIKNEDGKEYSGAVQLNFGPAGTNGSEATLIIKPINNYNKEDQYFQNAIGIGEENSLTYKVFLFDSNNKEIDFDKTKVQFELLGLNVEEEKINRKINNDEITLFCNEIIGENNIIAPILQASLSDYVSYTLTSQISIPISKNIKDYNYIKGITSILYKTDGTPYNYNYSESYGLINYKNEEIKNIKWSINETDKYYPTIDVETNILKPLPFYVKNLNTCVVLAKNSANEIIWSQAILIIQNCFPSGTVNKWDGSSLQLNEETGSILSPMLVAGQKNFKDNTFSGVMIGDLSREKLSTMTGIYGFKQGENTYAFKEDGTAFIGGSGAGRIEFDGDSGLIQSGNYKNTGQGMSIDLSKGKISANNKLFINSEEYQKVLDGESFNEQQEYYIKQNESQEFIQVDSPTQEELSNYYIKTVPLTVGKNFFVQWDGSINASSGVIGNWKIEKEGQLLGSGASLYQSLKLEERTAEIITYFKEKEQFNLFTLKYNVGIQKSDENSDQIKNKSFSTWIIEEYKRIRTINNINGFIEVENLKVSDEEKNKELEDRDLYSTDDIKKAIMQNSLGEPKYLKVYYFFVEEDPSQNPSNYVACDTSTVYKNDYEYYSYENKEYILIEINNQDELNQKINSGLKIYYLNDSIKRIKRYADFGENAFPTLSGDYYLYVYNSKEKSNPINPIDIDKTIQNNEDDWIKVNLNETGYETKKVETEIYYSVVVNPPEDTGSEEITKILLDPGSKNKNPGIFFLDKENENNYETFLQADIFQLKKSIFILKDQNGKAVVNLNESFILDERENSNSIIMNLPTRINGSLQINSKLIALEGMSLTGDLTVKNGQFRGMFKKITLYSSSPPSIGKNSYAKITVTTKTNLSDYIPLGVIKISSGLGRTGRITGFQYVNNNKFYVWLSNINNEKVKSKYNLAVTVVYAKAVF